MNIAKPLFQLCVLTLVVLGCSRPPRQTVRTTVEHGSVPWASNYVAKPDSVRRGDELPLVRLDYADRVSFGIILELLDRNAISHSIGYAHGTLVFVPSADFAKAKALLKSDTRLKGRAISIATYDY
jgi:hypothetical protein